MTYGLTVWKRRKALKWTQPELATRAHVSVDTVVRVEKNEYVSPTTKRAIDDALASGGSDQARQGQEARSVQSEEPPQHAHPSGVLAISSAAVSEIVGIAARLTELVGHLEPAASTVGRSDARKPDAPARKKTAERARTRKSS